eukprot:3932598-Rhodomonas_salina.1
MEGIELEALHETDFEDVGFMPHYFGMGSSRLDGARAREYDLDFRLAIHYVQCMIWMSNASFYEFHVFPPWERDKIRSTCTSKEREARMLR